MPVTHTNRKNVTYTLYRCKTKTGKFRYYFAKQSEKGIPCDAIPDGYEISETPNGVVSLARSRPKLIHKSEADLVQKMIDKHPFPQKYRIFVRHNRIDIYECINIDSDDLIDMFHEKGIVFGKSYRQIKEWWDYRSRFEPVMRFILQDKEKRMYGVERMCYLGSIEDWISVGKIDRLEVLAKDMIGVLGTDSFFDLI